MIVFIIGVVAVVINIIMIADFVDPGSFFISRWLVAGLSPCRVCRNCGFESGSGAGSREPFQMAMDLRHHRCLGPRVKAVRSGPQSMLMESRRLLQVWV